MFLRAKEETVSPVDGTKLTKEWMTELIQDEGDDRSGSGRKSKRSMDSDEEDANEVEMAAKQRAVDLLKTYIELQEEENRHLTQALNLATLAALTLPAVSLVLGCGSEFQEVIRPCIAMTHALNLATLAQTQRTDRYLDGVVATIIPTFPCFPRLSASRESRTHAVQRQCSKHVN